jgi:hypothetical protein
LLSTPFLQVILGVHPAVDVFDPPSTRHATMRWQESSFRGDRIDPDHGRGPDDVGAFPEFELCPDGNFAPALRGAGGDPGVR